MSQEEMLKKVEQDYGDLFDAVNADESQSKKKLSSFYPMKGKEYDNSEIRLMLIGRSPNGWDIDNDFSDNGKKDEFVKKAIKAVKSEDGYSWLNEDGICHYSVKTNGQEEQLTYNTNRSAFFRTAVNFLDKEYGSPCVCKRWFFERMIWTNLYPVSPVTGNPNGKMIKIQQKQAIALLRDQIEYFKKPTHILIVTDEWWFKPFGKELFNNVVLTNSQPVVAKGKYKDVPCVVTVRPERWKDTVMLESIINAFKQI